MIIYDASPICYQYTKFETATGLNKYFTEFGPNLASKLLKTAIDIYLISTLKPENTCSFHPVFPADQIWPACGDEAHFPDQWNESNWAWQFINLTAPFIVEPLTYVINLSFEPSEVPQDIKISSMMAWYKKKGSKIFPSEIENYLWLRRFVCKLVQ